MGVVYTQKKAKIETTEVLSNEHRLYRPSRQISRHALVSDFRKTIREAAQDPVSFWEKAAEDLIWFKKWKTAFVKRKESFFEWFVGARCNVSYNALDRHLGANRESKTAIISYDERGRTRKYTYRQLYEEVCRLSGALRATGIRKGQRVAIYLPNIPETAIAMLACARIGAMHSVVYAGFSAQALQSRIEDARASLLITADGSYRRGKFINLKVIADEAVRRSKTIRKVIVVKNTRVSVPFNRRNNVWYHEFIKGRSSSLRCTTMNSEDPLFVLYTSGTTAKPKGIVHVHGGYMVGVLRTIRWVFDLHGDEIFWCTADPGWITGHSYIVYGPLLAGISTVMYEGVPDYPKPDAIWKVIEKFKVSVLYTAPTAIRALMRYGNSWPKKHAMKSLRILGSVGEPINPEAWRWFYSNVGKRRCPIMDTWWQTETGMHMIAPLPVTPLKAGSATFPFPGIVADIVDKKGKSVPAGRGGFLIIRNQWPSMVRTIFNNPMRYIKTYWKEIPGVYFTGDLAHRDKDGYFWIQGRTDDVLKIAGHRIGTAEVESAFVAHPAVAEAAVIGVPDAIKGEVIKAFVILKETAKPSDLLVSTLRSHVRSTIGPMAVIKDIAFVEKLPKTRSGKIMRRVLKAQELGQPMGDTSTLI